MHVVLTFSVIGAAMTFLVTVGITLANRTPIFAGVAHQVSPLHWAAAPSWIARTPFCVVGVPSWRNLACNSLPRSAKVGGKAPLQKLCRYPTGSRTQGVARKENVVGTSGWAARPQYLSVTVSFKLQCEALFRVAVYLIKRLLTVTHNFLSRRCHQLDCLFEMGLSWYNF